MITVVNKRRVGPIPYNTVRVYIGRPTPLGNPFSHLDNTLAKFKVKTREESIEKYREWLTDKFAPLKDKGPEWDQYFHIWACVGHVDVELECWCAPLPCHGDVIKEWIKIGDD
jgi:hypothetical protein